MHEAVAPDETLAVLCNESLRIIQKRHGYRFSIDAILLANFVALKPRDRVLDVGTGCGIILLYLCAKGFSNHMVGVELQEELYVTATKNRALNGCSNVTFMRADVRERFDLPDGRPFNVLVCNPPFRAKNTGRSNPNRSRLLARSEAALDLSFLLDFASAALSSKGRAYVIYPAQRLAQVIAQASLKNLELKRLRFVHPRRGEPSNLFLAEFLKGGGTGTTVHAPLYIYDNDTYSDEVQTYYDLPGRAHGKSSQPH